jgi:hypothetical protein
MKNDVFWDVTPMFRRIVALDDQGDKNRRTMNYVSRN